MSEKKWISRPGLHIAQGRFAGDAEVQNEGRAWYKKMLGAGRVTKEDVAEKYADRMSSFVAAHMSEGMSEQSSLARWDIVHSPSNPTLVEPVVFVEMRDTWVEFLNGELSTEDINKWPEVRQRAETDIQIDAKVFWQEPEKFAAERDGWVQAGVISVDDANRLPEVQKKAKMAIEIYAKVHWQDPEKFAERRDGWVNIGVITLEEANQLPEVQKQAKMAIQIHAKIHWTEPQKFAARRDAWVNCGVVTLEEANQLPEVQEQAKMAIKITGRNANSYDAGSRKHHQDIVDGWVAAGVVTAEEAARIAMGV